MKALILIVLGTISTIIFAALSISAGMWGCGIICNIFIFAFFLSFLPIIYGIKIRISDKKAAGE